MNSVIPAEAAQWFVRKTFLTREKYKAQYTVPPLSSSKLYRLLFFAQGCHIAIYGSPLFEETMFPDNLDGENVPVLRSVAQRFPLIEAIQFGMNAEAKGISEETAAFLEQVYAVFAQYEDWKLQELIENTTDWILATKQKPWLPFDYDMMGRNFTGKFVE